jgi:uncharacterized protein YndB with AHSA1/START domain
MKNENQANKLTIVREFDATKEEVFEAFADGDALSQWWGPAGFITTTLKLEFKPGGIFHYRMQQGEAIMYAKFVYQRIETPDLLEFITSFTDEKANVVKAPFDVEIPKEILYTFVFSEKNGKTTMIMTGTPINANASEEAGFSAIEDSMQQGFGASFDQLVVYLKK